MSQTEVLRTQLDNPRLEVQRLEVENARPREEWPEEGKFVPRRAGMPNRWNPEAMTAAACQPRERSESGWESSGDESRTPEISQNSFGNLLVPRAVVCLWPGFQQSITDCISGSGKYEHRTRISKKRGSIGIKHSHTTVCYHAFVSTMNIGTQ